MSAITAVESREEIRCHQRECAIQEVYDAARGLTWAKVSPSLRTATLALLNSRLPTPLNAGELRQATDRGIGAAKKIADGGGPRQRATPMGQVAEAGEGKNPWIAQVRTLADAYAPREPIPYIVAGIYSVPSVSLLVGDSGKLKTLLLMDLCACLAAGKAWLPSLPNGQATTFTTKRSPVVWLNFDNSGPIMDSRFEAIGRGHGLAADAPLYYLTHPVPTLDATSPESMARLESVVRWHEAKFVVIDNLQCVRGAIDENSAEMGSVIVAFRQISEACGCAVALIHHTNKGGGFRGSTAIENLVDFSLLVERDGLSPDIMVKPGKMRNAEVPTFGATFTYTHRAGTSDLETARFWGMKVDVANDREEVKAAILDFIRANPRANLTAIQAEIQAAFDDIGRVRVYRVVKELTAKGKMREFLGPRRSKLYEII